MAFFLPKIVKLDSLEDAGFVVDAVLADGFVTGDYQRCLACDNPLSKRKWLPPYEIELETWGNRFGDVAYLSGFTIFSDRFLKVIEENHLVGLEEIVAVKLVKVTRRSGEILKGPPGYFKAEIRRSITRIDQDASGYVWQDETKKCPECLFDTLLRYRCLTVKEGTWAGEDIFIPRGGRRPLVSEKFKQVFVDNGLEGLVFIPSHLPEAEYDSYPWIK